MTVNKEPINQYFKENPDEFHREIKQKTRKKYNDPENQFKKSFIKYLTDKGHIVTKTTAIKQGNFGGKKFFTNYEAGIFDLIVCTSDGKYFEFDTKSKTGIPTDSQKKRIEKFKNFNLENKLFFVSEKNFKSLMEELKL